MNFERAADTLGEEADSGARIEPFLSVGSVMVYVRDQTLSRQFYLEKLGFRLVFDSAESDDAVSRYFRSAGLRWITVAPMFSVRSVFSGSALSLIKPPEGSEQARRIASKTDVMFLTDNIAAKHKEWARRGVVFEKAPTPEPWGIHAIFSDLDGNRFDLIQSPWLVQLLEAERHKAEERREARRRATFELEMAKEVQYRLFPQSMPRLRTLQYTGQCVQAREVGGDYYDFLDLGRGGLGLVLGDVAGKGFPAALLMANLQANLRSQYALALVDLKTMLKSVNRLFYENTPDSSYTTLFFAEYDDGNRRLRYANCGHLPPLLVHGDGNIERLTATSTVLGIFPDWECVLAQATLEPEDTLVIYTDGVTEARSSKGDEFGESRLRRLLTGVRCVAPEALLRTILDAVQDFSGREQADDITVVVARCTTR